MFDGVANYTLRIWNVGCFLDYFDYNDYFPFYAKTLETLKKIELKIENKAYG